MNGRGSQSNLFSHVFPYMLFLQKRKIPLFQGLFSHFPLFWNRCLPCIPGWPQIKKYSCFTHVNVVVKDMLHYIQYFQEFYYSSVPYTGKSDRKIFNPFVHKILKFKINNLKHFKLPTKIFIVFIWKITLVREIECSFSFL